MDIVHFKNLTELTVDEFCRSDTSVLAGLTKLTKLIFNNKIGDSGLRNLSPLSGLTELNLAFNQITDISVLSNLKKLNKLGLYGYEETNQINDWSPVDHVLRVGGRP